MQLRMTAPTDIGLESQDQALKGQGPEDFFDINEAESRKATKAGDDGLMTAYDEGGWSSEDELRMEEEPEYLDSEEEREARLQHLEGEIDDMYDAYTGAGTSVVPYAERADLEEARAIFVRAIPPEDQDWMTKSATIIR